MNPFRNTIIRTTGAAILAAGIFASLPASAQWGGYRRGPDGGEIAAGVVGGLALGAVAAGAAQQQRYAEPVYSEDGECTIQRQRVWDGERYRTRRVRVCE